MADTREKGLTLRGVAEQAGTTTTTVYKRFRNKEQLLHALAERVYQQLIVRITSAASLEEACRRYLSFAENHPEEYKLLYARLWTTVFAPGRSRPTQEWTLAQLASRFGGDPNDYVQSHFALFLVVHGAASLLMNARGRALIETRESASKACATLIANAPIFREKKARG